MYPSCKLKYIGKEFGKSHWSQWNDVPQIYQVLIPGTCRCYLIWTKGLCRCDSVKNLEMRRLSWITQGALTAITGTLREEGEGRRDSNTHTHTHTQHEGHITTEQTELWKCCLWRLDRCDNMPRNASCYQKREEARNKCFPNLQRQGGPAWFGPSETHFSLLAFRAPREYISVVLNDH